MPSPKPLTTDDPAAGSAPGAVRSMTGFASLRRGTASGEIHISLRSVNHRSLDLHFHTSYEFSPFESDLRELLKRTIKRGHVEVRLNLRRTTGDGTATIDRAALAAYIQAFRQIAQELDLRYQPDLHALLGLRGVVADSTANGIELPPELKTDVLAAAEECVQAFNEQREREGSELRREMLQQADAIAEGATAIRAVREQALPHFQTRLAEKLRDLLGNSAVSESRLVEEAALLADRSDIEEELVRLSVHSTALGEALRNGGEAGKRLDFLLQEMNREVNTLLAKSAGAGAPGLQITNTGLAIKANIEKIREQALNLE